MIPQDLAGYFETSEWFSNLIREHMCTLYSFPLETQESDKNLFFTAEREARTYEQRLLSQAPPPPPSVSC